MFWIARKCQGVRDFVRFTTASGEDEPFPIPGREVADLMSRQRSREFGQVAIGGKRKLIERRRKEYSPGMKFRVVEGSFLSFVAQVDRMRKSGAIEATIQVFGRPTRIVLESPEKFLRAI